MFLSLATKFDKIFSCYQLRLVSIEPTFRGPSRSSSKCQFNGHETRLITRDFIELSLVL